MIPILYPADQRSFWANNGLGGLPDAISCIVTEQRNTQGGYWLEMDYPVDGLHYNDLAVERIIFAAPSMKSLPQPFRISRISRPINGIVHIEAPHISSALQKITTYGLRSATNVQTIVDGFFDAAHNLGQTFNFAFDSNVMTQTAVTVDHTEPTTLADLLLGAEGSILDLTGGEFEFYEWDVIQHIQRGVDSGLEIRYGVNMSDIEAETDTSELVTAVIPYWKGSVNGVDTVVVGSMCSSSNASAYAYTRCIPLDVSQQFELAQDQQPTQAQVTAKGREFINSSALSELTMSISVKYQPLLESRTIRLCDTVRVVHPDLGVSVSAKVVETKYNTLTERYDELTIGTMRQTIVDTIAGILRGG